LRWYETSTGAAIDMLNLTSLMPAAAILPLGAGVALGAAALAAALSEREFRGLPPA
jgi:hypothetical protein